MAVAALQEGGIKRVTEEFPVVFVKYSRGLQSLASTRIKARTLATPIIAVVLWGRTRTGKTYRAHKALESVPYYVKMSGNKWWDGYGGEQFVIIDEVLNCIELPDLLKWLDPYPCKVEVKGGTVELAATKFILTSNYHPEAWFEKAGRGSIDALLARFSHVIQVDSREDDIDLRGLLQVPEVISLDE